MQAVSETGCRPDSAAVDLKMQEGCGPFNHGSNGAAAVSCA
jgi:hypothetical protein